MKNFQNKNFIISLVLFLIILAIAITYRVLFINMGFWYDEACSWSAAINDFPVGIINYLLTVDLQHTPLYFFLLHFWIKMFGTSEVAMKSLSLIFGIASLPLVYVISKKISDKLIAFFATTIVAISPIIIMFSDEARMYAAAMFLVLLSINFFIDVYNNKPNSKIKLLITNLLIPYTLVGGILYNISLWIFGLHYFIKNKKEDLKNILKYFYLELILLIPYFILVIYYASQRIDFVIKHEMKLQFYHIAYLIFDSFAITPSQNIYWPNVTSLPLDIKSFVFIVIPSIYFIYGFIQGFKNSKGFLKVLYEIILLNLVLFIIATYFEVCVCTVRYIIYVLPIIFILSLIGLSKKLSKVHLIIFAIFFITSSMYLNIDTKRMQTELKTNALKLVRLEADSLGLTEQDMVILPFSADAPYYFRTLGSPKVLIFDFHKEIRNPKNPKFYDFYQQKYMSGFEKYEVFYNSIHSDNPFSSAHEQYFLNQISSVPKGRYILVALYGDDASHVVPEELIKQNAANIGVVKLHFNEFVFEVYMRDVISLLNRNCKFIGDKQNKTYKFFIFQKIK